MFRDRVHLNLVWVTAGVLVSLFACIRVEGQERSKSYDHLGFSKDLSIERATHIVVATEGETVDGVLSVLESWQGDLQEGDTLDIPELAPPESQADFGNNLQPAFSDSTAATDTPMVLFLVKSLSAANGPSGPLRTKWLPSSWPEFVPSGVTIFPMPSDSERMWTSVVWLAQDAVTGYVEGRRSPFRSYPDRTPLTEVQLRANVEEWLDRQLALRAINAVADPATRVRQAIAWGHANPENLFDFLEIVAGSGDGALPGLQEMIADAAFEPLWPEVVEAFADVGGAAAGSDLMALLETDLLFWQKRAPTLKAGWWNDFNGVEDIEQLRSRYTVTLNLLYAFQKIGYPECKPLVTRFRDFWRSLPQLEDKTGSNQMSQTCDEVLNPLYPPSWEPSKYAWGFRLAASEPDPVQRAKALVPYLTIGDWRMRGRNFNALAECGTPALPVLRTVLQDETHATNWSVALRYLAKVGGPGIGPEIARMLGDQLAFVKSSGLAKSATEWNSLSANARCHLGKLASGVKALSQIGYADAVEEVRAIADYSHELALAGFTTCGSLTGVCKQYLGSYGNG